MNAGLNCEMERRKSRPGLPTLSLETIFPAPPCMLRRGSLLDSYNATSLGGITSSCLQSRQLSLRRQLWRKDAGRRCLSKNEGKRHVPLRWLNMRGKVSGIYTYIYLGKWGSNFFPRCHLLLQTLTTTTEYALSSLLRCTIPDPASANKSVFRRGLRRSGFLYIVLVSFR